MKYFLISLLTLTQVAFGGLPPATNKGQSDAGKQVVFNTQVPFNQKTSLGGVTALIETGNPNMLKDPGFEGDGTAWTASGGTYTQTTTAANLGSGAKAASWDSSAASQTFTSTAVTIQGGLAGRNAVLSCNIQGASATHTIGVWDGSTLTNTQTITSAAGYNRTNVNFIAGAIGTTVAVRLTSVASNEPTIYIDDCFVAPADEVNLTQVSQATFIGSAKITATASCNWSRTNTSYGSFATVAACPGPTVISNPGPGTIQTTDTDLPIFTVNSLPAGTYDVRIKVIMSQDASMNAYCRIYDGSTQIGWAASNNSTTTTDPVTLQGFVTYTAASNRSFEVQCGSASSTVNVLNASAENDAVFSITRLPSSSEQAYTANTTASSWSGYHTAAGATWTRSNTAYGDMTPTGTAAIVQRTNTNFGTVTTAASNLPGITFTPAGAYKYRVCAYTKANVGAASVYGAFRLWDGTTVITEAGMREAANLFNTMPICGHYQATSVAPVTITIQCKADSSACEIAIPTNAVSNIEWVIEAINQGFPAPLLTGQRDEVWVYTANGYGSTNNKIRRFTTTGYSSGNSVTYADSAANGGSFTINNPGVYSISYCDQFTSSQYLGISVNSSQLTTGIDTITAADRRVMTTSQGANTSSCVSTTLFLTTNDVARAHTTGVASGTLTTSESFRITRVN